jgi:hypothetical protein
MSSEACLARISLPGLKRRTTMANKQNQDSSKSKTPGSGLPRSESASGTGGTRRARIMKDDGVLPGDKARAADERGKRDDEDALDSGTSDGTTLGSSRGSASRATKGSSGGGASKKGSKPTA